MSPFREQLRQAALATKRDVCLTGLNHKDVSNINCDETAPVIYLYLSTADAMV